MLNVDENHPGAEELLVLPGHLFLEIDVLLMKYAKSRAGDGMSIGIPGISNNPEA